MAEGSRPADFADSLLIPILVGVTGHRELRDADVPALTAALERLFRELLPSGADRRELVVMSPLAQGADQLVARVALAAGARLWVPLPIERSEYLKDFTDASAAEFMRLIAQADTVIDLGLAPGSTASGVAQAGPQRRAQYALANAWILRRCHVLVALWDGAGPATLGGTACTVGWRLNGLPETPGERRSALDAAEGGPVWQVVTPRPDRAAPTDVAGTVIRKYPGSPDDDEAAGARLLATLSHLRGVNRELVHADAKLGDAISARREALIDTATLDALPEPVRLAGRRCAAADALALAHQGSTRAAVPFVFAAGFASIVCLELFAHVFTGDPWWLGGYVVAFLGGFAVIRLARHREHEQRHVDYRALAEAMRVQFYWRLAGSAEWAADHHLRLHRTELDWVREALRGWSAAPQDASPGAADAHRWRLVREGWVRSEARWFAEKADARRASFTRCRAASSAFLWAGFTTVSVLLALLVAPGARATPVEDAALHAVPPYVHLLIVVSALLMLVGALARAFAEKMAFEAESDRYRLMQPIFERADARLVALLDAGALGDARRLVEELGREALAENAEWLLARRERKLGPITGG